MHIENISNSYSERDMQVARVVSHFLKKNCFLFQKLSILGLKNLIQEKTGVSPGGMKVTAEKGIELSESTERFGPMFLRDYPHLKDGSTVVLETSGPSA